MATVTGTSSFAVKLNVLKAKAKEFEKKKLWVGYTAEYAVFVHENLKAHHPVGQAKFLEEPARDQAVLATMRQAIVTVLRNGGTPDEAMYAAGLVLQAASQKLCPIDTGFLRNSVQTLVETV